MKKMSFKRILFENVCVCCCQCVLVEFTGEKKFLFFLTETKVIFNDSTPPLTLRPLQKLFITLLMFHSEPKCMTVYN